MHGNTRLLALCLPVGFLGALCLAISARLDTGYPPGARPEPFRYLLGQRAPLLRLQTAEGDTIALAELSEGGQALLAFVRADCRACDQARSALVAVMERMPGALVGVAADADVVQELARRELSFVVVPDEQGEVTRAFEVPWLPSAVVVDGDGVVVEAGAGREGLERLAQVRTATARGPRGRR